MSKAVEIREYLTKVRESRYLSRDTRSSPPPKPSEINQTMDHSFDDVTRILDDSSSSESSLTDAQEMILALTPIIPGILSIMGSCTLIRLVIRKGFDSPFRRILFLISAYDILNSVVVNLQNFLTPEETSRRIWAIGNDQSCTAMGFFFQFSYPSSQYFAVLSFYYILTIRFGMKDQTFAKYVEPIFHIVVLGFSSITAIIGASKGWYGEVSLGAGCWLQVTDGCDEDCLANRAWIYGGLPFFIALISIIVNNIWVYWYVRSTVQKSRRRMFRPNPAQQSGMMEPSSVLDNNEASSQFFRPQQPQPPIRDEQAERVYAVGVQAMLYVFVFMMTYAWTIIIRLLANDGADQSQEQEVFAVMVLRAIFLPAMGLGTVLVYVRPRYIRCRGYYPEEGRYWALSQVLRDTDWQDKYRARRRRTQNFTRPEGPVSPLQQQVSNTDSNSNSNSGRMYSMFFGSGRKSSSQSKDTSGADCQGNENGPTPMVDTSQHDQE